MLCLSERPYAATSEDVEASLTIYTPIVFIHARTINDFD
jgi:hypothetical protein